jgi:hypothetical protein
MVWQATSCVLSAYWPSSCSANLRNALQYGQTAYGLSQTSRPLAISVNAAKVWCGWWVRLVLWRHTTRALVITDRSSTASPSQRALVA